MEEDKSLTQEEASEAWERFENLVRAVATTPKDVVMKGLAEEKAARKAARETKKKLKDQAVDIPNN